MDRKSMELKSSTHGDKPSRKPGQLSPTELQKKFTGFDRIYNNNPEEYYRGYKETKQLSFRERYLQITGSDLPELHVDEESHPVFMEDHAFLLRSKRYVQPLAKLANSDKKVTIRDFSTDNPRYDKCLAYHDPLTNTIYMPLKNRDGTPLDVLERRDMLLFEMGNANGKNRYLRRLYEERTPTDSKSVAAFAIANEWSEWVNTAEHAYRCEAINNDPDMSEKGPHVRSAHIEAFERPTQPDADWHIFPYCLKYQIECGHTAVYDPKASESSWMGQEILLTVRDHNPASLVISKKQKQDWLSGKTEHIKPFDDNPFIDFLPNKG